MKLKNHIWVIELQDDGGKWSPTIGVALTRLDAGILLREWKGLSGYPCRVRKYVVAG